MVCAPGNTARLITDHDTVNAAVKKEGVLSVAVHMEFLKLILQDEETRTCGVNAVNFKVILAERDSLGGVALAAEAHRPSIGARRKPNVRVVNTVWDGSIERACTDK